MPYKKSVGDCNPLPLPVLKFDPSEDHFPKLALSIMLRVAGFAQDTSQGSVTDKGAPAAPLKNIKGTVRADGDKLTFVADQDSKAWHVVKPEALKVHEGHHVE